MDIFWCWRVRGSGFGVTWEDLSMQEDPHLSWGKIISMKGELDFPALFKKNNEKLNIKKKISTESKEQHQNLE